MSTFLTYSPTSIVAKAMFNFDAFGVANFKVSGIVRVSVSDDFNVEVDYFILFYLIF